MDNNFASFSKEKFLQQKLLSFAEIPGQSKLFIDYQNNSGQIENFYPSKNKGFAKIAEDVLANYKIDRNRLCDILLEKNIEYKVGEKTLGNINKLRGEDCVAIIAGQQAGLFSGAMYTIYKALSAVKLAEELTIQGIKAVPLFWIASEDHDFDEANKTFVIDEAGNLNTITNKTESIKEHTPVAYIELGENIPKTIDDYFDSLPHTEFTDEIKQLLTETYQADESYSSAFARLILKLFGEYGIILICPMNEGLRQLCTPIFNEAIEKHEVMTRELLKRNEQLEEKGYHTQVLVPEDFFPFFYIDKDNKRNALRFDKETNLVNSLYSDISFTKADLLEIAKNSPQQLSPNVLMRSVVQDFLFPTVCYYGGSAEIAYFAQNEVIYKILNRPVTHFRHRSSFTIVDPKSQRTLDKYDLQFKDVFRGVENLLAEVIEKFIAENTAETFAEVEETINVQLNELDKMLRESDPTLSDNLANRRRKILWHIETLRKKFHRAETFKNDVLHRRIEYAINLLYPRCALQERTMNVFYFLNLYGENFIDWIYQAIDSDEKEHQILFL
ncbi:MAG: bacillithiol biosynthesis cysteine-adding enzyme BshC [Aridibacter sp.]